MQQGTVRWFDTDRGYGFIAPSDSSPDIFVHASEVVTDGPRILREGQEVEFEVGEGPRGPQALGVRITGDLPPDAALGVLATVSWYEPGKGYGFAAPDGGTEEVFVHSSAIVTGGVLSQGQRVAFLVVAGERGAQAAHVVPLGDTAGPALVPLGDTTGPAIAPEVLTDDGADGTVGWFDEAKAFGFITPDEGGDDVFLHIRALLDHQYLPVEGDRVTFSVVRMEKGPQAREVRLVSPGDVAPAPAAGRGDGPRGGGAGGRGDAARGHGAAVRGRSDRAGGATRTPVRGGEGVVARYDADRGFGFITPDDGGADLFVHVSVIADGQPLQPGDQVRFGVRQSDRGPQADRVERL